MGQSLGKWGCGRCFFFEVFGERERRAKKGRKFFFFPCLAHPGEEDSECRSKRHYFGALHLFFFKQWMKRHHFGQSAPFHLQGNGAKNVSEFKSVHDL
jgi:hypothetical protein